MPSPLFAVGDVVRHRLFGYRGVVIGVDPIFQGTEEWYALVARSRPPKHAPWYHVLPHDAAHQTYVAERNLDTDETGLPVRHPFIDRHFTAFQDGRYMGDVPPT